jgi:hypothetical protein
MEARKQVSSSNKLDLILSFNIYYQNRGQHEREIDNNAQFL